MSEISHTIFLAGWITGFTDGEGCFSVSFSKREKFALGIETRPSFSISQKGPVGKESVEILESFFGCGAIRYSRNDDTWKYETRNLNELLTKVIPFFQKNLLKTNKKNDFVLFCDCCFLMKNNQHLNKKGLRAILQKAYQMNSAGTRKYTLEELLKILPL